MHTKVFQLVDVATEQPYGCAGCGNQQGPYIATGAIPPFVSAGEVYLCTACVRSIAQVFELAPAADLKAANERANQLHAEASQAAAELGESRRRVHELEQQLEQAQQRLEQAAAEKSGLVQQVADIDRELREAKSGAAQRRETALQLVAGAIAAPPASGRRRATAKRRGAAG